MHPIGYLLLVAAQLPTIPARDFPDALQKKAVAATVKVVNTVAASSGGSGSIVGREGPFAYVLTAAHVVGKAETVEDSRLRRRLVSESRQDVSGHDPRSCRRLGSGARPDSNQGRTARNARYLSAGGGSTREKRRRAKRGLRPGRSTDSSGGNATLERKKIRARRGSGNDLDLGGCSANRNFWAVPAGRRLLDKTGRLIGVATGHGTERGYYSHVDEVYPFLQRNGFRSLFSEESR